MAASKQSKQTQAKLHYCSMLLNGSGREKDSKRAQAHRHTLCKQNDRGKGKKTLRNIRRHREKKKVTDKHHRTTTTNQTGRQSKAKEREKKNKKEEQELSSLSLSFFFRSLSYSLRNGFLTIEKKKEWQTCLF